MCLKLKLNDVNLFFLLFSSTNIFCQTHALKPPTEHHRAEYDWPNFPLGKDHWTEKLRAFDWIVSLPITLPNTRGNCLYLRSGTCMFWLESVDKDSLEETKVGVIGSSVICGSGCFFSKHHCVVKFFYSKITRNVWLLSLCLFLVLFLQFHRLEILEHCTYLIELSSWNQKTTWRKQESTPPIELFGSDTKLIWTDFCLRKIKEDFS